MQGQTQTPVLQITGLSKAFGKRQILSSINLEVQAGEIFGFLGPNGSGKTTTIKLALGLLRIDTGSIRICGKEISSQFEQAIANVGGIIENPEMYKYLSGRDNLRQYMRMYGKIDEGRIDEVVKLVRLEGRINDKISKYSLGMRQRLGVAQALLNKPRLLVLDEPTNGLDPAGIKDLRDILKDLASQGLAVFVSSHQLAELELMCNRFGIIDRGVLVDVKTIDEMQRVNVDKSLVFEIKSTSPEYARLGTDALITAGIKAEQVSGDIHVICAQEVVPQAVRSLVYADIPIISVTQIKRSLEEAFIEITTNDAAGGVGV